MKLRRVLAAAVMGCMTMRAYGLTGSGTSANLADLISTGGTLSAGGVTYGNFTASGGTAAATFTVTASAINDGSAITLAASSGVSGETISYDALGASAIASAGLSLVASGTSNPFATAGETLTDPATNNQYSLQALVPGQTTDAVTFSPVTISVHAVLSLDTFNAPNLSATNAYLLALLDGDANGDGKVDLNDLNIVLNHLGGTYSARGDGNFDGAPTIDLNDLNAVLNHLGTSNGASGTATQALVAASAPEPATLSLIAASALMVMRRRRR